MRPYLPEFAREASTTIFLVKLLVACKQLFHCVMNGFTVILILGPTIPNVFTFFLVVMSWNKFLCVINPLSFAANWSVASGDRGKKCRVYVSQGISCLHILVLFDLSGVAELEFQLPEAACLGSQDLPGMWTVKVENEVCTSLMCANYMWTTALE